MEEEKAKDILEAKRIISRGEWSSLSKGKEGLKKKKKNHWIWPKGKKKTMVTLPKTLLGGEAEAEVNPRG